MSPTLEGPSPSEEDNNIVVEPVSLDKRHSIECYVLDIVDPLTRTLNWVSIFIFKP